MPNSVLELFGLTCEVAMINLGLIEGIPHMKIGMSGQEWALHDTLDNSNVDCPYFGFHLSLCSYNLFDHPWKNKIVTEGASLDEISALDVLKTWIKSLFFTIVHEYQFFRLCKKCEQHVQYNRCVFVNSFQSMMNLLFRTKAKLCR